MAQDSHVPTNTAAECSYDWCTNCQALVDIVEWTHRQFDSESIYNYKDKIYTRSLTLQI